ncbi:acyltransferase family protein [Corynebacterium auris]|uniref:acyltransferase family protein n=1 Tax=Corynebacterium auris TaxID=44750 RepID=UPI0025B30F03|nr:acyltransferase [Corynebacterium auris]WJY68931.1 Acyltransferase family protein [Corynebacterium auris]
MAFQTATESRILERFDYFVAVFFALSAFLLARGGHRPGYYQRRLARLAPAYVVCVVVVALTLPELTNLSVPTFLANLFLVQIYVPDALIAGLTQMWSLCVEVAFYLVLPAYLALGTRGRWAALAVAVPLSFAWPWLIDSVDWVNMQIWPPSYVSWFAVGLAAAELERAGVRWRWPRWPVVLLFLPIAWLGGVAGPPGLEHPTPAEFNLRILLGACFAAVLVVPFALGPRDDAPLASPLMTRLGRWSYSIFLWHVAVLSFAFPVLGVPLFSGYFLPVLAFTAAFSIAVAYVSYEWIEVPGARWLRRALATGTPRGQETVGR